MRVTVPGDLLTWASERSGVPADRLAARFPGLDRWISGDSRPTLKQLETFARATYTPVGYFFLSEPPAELLPIQDFRIRAARRMGSPSPHLLDTIFACQARQDWYREFALANGEDEIRVVGSMRTDTDPVAAGSRIRAALDFEPGTRGSSWSDAFRRLAEHAEDLGVLVMASGIVGSNTRRPLDPGEFGGFALADPVAPVVFVNGADTKAAQVFTLAHELAHVWSGGSALDDARPDSAPGQDVEQWCNAVAGEILVPGAALVNRRLGALDPDELDLLAAEFRVSTLVVLRRLYDLGRVDRTSYWMRYDAESARLRGLGEAAPRRGGSFYNTQPVRTSKRFARALIADTLEGRTLYRDAFRLLGFKKESTFVELSRRLGVVA